MGGEVDLWFFPSYILVYTQPRSSICKPTIIKLSLQLFQMKYLLLDTISMELRCPFQFVNQSIHGPFPPATTQLVLFLVYYVMDMQFLNRSHGRFEALQDKRIVPMGAMRSHDMCFIVLKNKKKIITLRDYFSKSSFSDLFS